MLIFKNQIPICLECFGGNLTYHQAGFLGHKFKRHDRGDQQQKQNCRKAPPHFALAIQKGQGGCQFIL
jgi:hypothetical protein